MSAFEINVPHHYVYLVLSALYLYHGMGFESHAVWLIASLSYALLWLKK